jgi:hypothetical protein
MRRPLRLNPALLPALLGFLWAVTVGALRDFVWADLRDGLISTNGLSRLARMLIVISFVLLGAMLATLVLGDFWRQRLPLEPSIISAPGRGALAPTLLLPASIFILAVAWSLALTGARAGGGWLRGGVLALYLLMAAGWVTKLRPDEGNWHQVAWGSVALAVLLVLLPRRWLPRAEWAFIPLLFAVGAMFSAVQYRLLAVDRLSGLPLGQASLEANILTLTSYALPLLLLIGLDIADFTRHASAWVSAIVAQRFAPGAVYAALLLGAALLVYDLRAPLTAWLAPGQWPQLALAYLGALGIPVLTLGWWKITRRHGPPLTVDQVGAAAAAVAPPLVVVYLLPVLILAVMGDVAQVIGVTSVLETTPWSATLTAGLNMILAAFDLVTEEIEIWYTGVAVAALCCAGWLLWRGRRAPGLYLGVVSLLLLWGRATDRDAWLGWLHWESPAIEIVTWFVLLALVAAARQQRRQLTQRRAAALLTMLSMLLLLRQTDFIENPFSPFFAFAGIGFVAFGIAWDTLTVGAWANRSTRRLPRLSRIFLYLAYVLLTVTLVNWAVMTHNVVQVNRFTGETALLGLDVLGKPLLYVIFVLLLFGDDAPPEAPAP